MFDFRTINDTPDEVLLVSKQADQNYCIYERYHKVYMQYRTSI